MLFHESLYFFRLSAFRRMAGERKGRIPLLIPPNGGRIAEPGFWES